MRNSRFARPFSKFCFHSTLDIFRDTFRHCFRLFSRLAKILHYTLIKFIISQIGPSVG